MSTAYTLHCKIDYKELNHLKQNNVNLYLTRFSQENDSEIRPDVVLAVIPSNLLSVAGNDFQWKENYQVGMTNQLPENGDGTLQPGVSIINPDKINAPAKAVDVGKIIFFDASGNGNVNPGTAEAKDKITVSNGWEEYGRAVVLGEVQVTAQKSEFRPFYVSKEIGGGSAAPQPGKTYVEPVVKVGVFFFPETPVKKLAPGDTFSDEYIAPSGYAVFPVDFTGAGKSLTVNWAAGGNWEL